MDKVLENIIDNLNAWTERIVDVEERLKKSTDIRKSVLDSLNRQVLDGLVSDCLLYTSPSPRDRTRSRMPSSA